MRRCSVCLDVVIYCSCALEDDSWKTNQKRWVTDNPSFTIFRGDEEAEWIRETRELVGDKKLVQDITKHLTGEDVVVLHQMSLPMIVEDPYAVHHVASFLLDGCSFSESAPDWDKYSQPGVIY